ncbi:MAG: L-serine ammonia-lyase, iron-sulfur-dependent, subunit alpha [Spirochaetaceae bacterium]|jgi:L-serine dehydratase|nr:L-serine ammonia-lyase, iron-sulfur-dependent, subunit alpha [Spirochaetaceae bacterium]
MFDYRSFAALAAAAEEGGTAVSAVVLADQARQMERSEKELFNEMRAALEVMKAAVAGGSDPLLRSPSGLSGGLSFKMKERLGKETLSGPFCTAAIARALAAAEYNAAMGRIVAAPTAGACGILPAAVLTMLEGDFVAGDTGQRSGPFRRVTEDAAVMSLFTAGALGMVIAGEACIAGAEGGCQAECGSASAMAAAALTELAGGSPAGVSHAAAIALKNQLGLVCDPVAGLVEVPCVKRNAGGIMCAIGAAEMALAGIESVIPLDEVIAAMGEIGAALPASLRETARGGLAATPSGLEIRRKIFG